MTRGAQERLRGLSVGVGLEEFCRRVGLEELSGRGWTWKVVELGGGCRVGFGLGELSSRGSCRVGLGLKSLSGRVGLGELSVRIGFWES